MIDPEREELLSAYLDGEVSPDERVRVEQWLAESSELRQMRDELLAIRTDLQALPRHQVGHDLAAVVMHRSTAATTPDQSARSAAATGPVTTKESPLRNIVVEWWNRGSQGRRFLWPALAVAAALAILVFDARQRPTEFEVAQAPDPATAEPQEEAKDLYAAPGEQPNIGGTAEMPLPDASAPPAADSNIRGSAPVAASRSAETRAPATNRDQSDFFNAMPESAPADGAARAAAPANAPAAVPKVGGALYDKRAEVSAQALTVETIICPVTLRYLEERKFEKLLNENQVRWRRVPIPPELQVQSIPQTPRTAPLESLGKSPLQSLYFLQAESAQVNGILSQVPQADKLMEGNRLATVNAQQSLKAGASGEQGGVQVMLVAPVDVAAPKAQVAPASKPAP